jgi:UDP-N-acetylmuramoyl-L-alanyl-D-glutamate--2,6-diaminopimelate ligase
MQKLINILSGLSVKELIGDKNLLLSSVVFDSRKVLKSSLFVAVKGTQVDGHNFIDKAIELGANSIICETLPYELDSNITYIQVKDSSFSLGIIASNFYNNPSLKLKLIGVTGTNGKTTTVTLLYNLFKLLGHKVGLLSTVVNKINEIDIHSTHTTPDAIEINKLLAEMLKQECDFVFMEVSSHAVSQNRISGLNFTGGVFSNITREHLDYHNTFEDYVLAKKKFFDLLPSSAFALINTNQEHAKTMIEDTKAKVFSYALNSKANYIGEIVDNDFSGLNLEINCKRVRSKLIGKFNAYNILSAYSTAILLEQDEELVLSAIKKIDAPEGRFEYYISQNDIRAIVDYAHTPDALENVLRTINAIRTGNEKLITVLGCGGDRDKGKRPLMAKIACDYTNHLILTSDNPRTENPNDIISDMQKGIIKDCFKKTLSILDRKQAIKEACRMSNSKDILLIAGKGHEKYQEINGEKIPFDDMKILVETLNNNK